MIRRYLTLVCILASIWLSIPSSFAALPANITGLYVFGDSLSDIGNYRSTGSNCLIPGEMSAPITNHSGGNFYNKTWVNFVAEKYGLVVSPGSLANGQTKHGTDWAVSGAETRDIITQVDQYLANNAVDPNALYAIWAGPNDVMDKLNPANHPAGYPPKPEQVVYAGMTDIAFAVDTLAKKGAKHILVIGMPDISLTPGVYFEELETPGSHLRAAMHKLAAGWNDALYARDVANPGHAPLAYVKQQFAAQPEPKTKLYVWNPTPFLTQVVANPTLYHFAPSVDHQANNLTMWCALHQNMSPDDFIFFNLIHPSAHAHSHLAEAIIQQAALF